MWLERNEYNTCYQDGDISTKIFQFRVNFIDSYLIYAPVL